MILTRAARGLIAGSSADSRGLEGRQAALLYFDELQITDPFTAVSLKGACTTKYPACEQTCKLTHSAALTSTALNRLAHSLMQP